MSENNPTRPVMGAIFDCDGTLLDSMGLWLVMEDELAEKAGRPLTQAEGEALRGYTIQETGAFFHRVLGLGESPQDVEGMIVRRAVDFYAHEAKARPGAFEFLRALVDAGVPCAVVSSSPHSMLDPGLESNGMTDLLQIVVSTDDVGASKRTSVPFERAREVLGSPREATWVFEDSTYALQTVREAGYRSVGTWDRDESGTYEELAQLADIAVRSWDELDVNAFLNGGLTS